MIGEKIKKLRTARSLSQAQLAEKTKVLSQSQIAKIETGRRKASFEEASVLASALEVSIPDLTDFQSGDRKAGTENSENEGETTEKEKPPMREQILKSFRPSEDLDAQISALAERTGASYNSTVCLLVALGLREFKSQG